jgi:hypothetical protein
VKKRWKLEKYWNPKVKQEEIVHTSGAWEGIKTVFLLQINPEHWNAKKVALRPLEKPSEHPERGCKRRGKGVGRTLAKRPESQKATHFSKQSLPLLR